MTLITTPSADDSDSYATVDQFEAYCVRMGYDIASLTEPDKEAALRKAAMYLDGTFGNRFIGKPAMHDQALEWPRIHARYRGKDLPSNEIPARVVSAACEAAFIVSQDDSALFGSWSGSTSQVLREKVGDLEVQYADNTIESTADLVPTFTVIEGLLLGLISPDMVGKVNFGLALRG